jgi:hypothetical protein
MANRVTEDGEARHDRYSPQESGELPPAASRAEL